jgi:hypothetical protein
MLAGSLPAPDPAQPVIARLWRGNVCAEKLEVYAGDVRRPESPATCAPRLPGPRTSSPAKGLGELFAFSL